MTATSFDAFFRRVAEAIGVETQNDLARVLGVNRSAITQAKQRNAIPQKWLHALARDYGYSARWLESGEGSKNAGAPASEPFEVDCLHIPKVRARLCAGGGSFEVEAQTVDTQPFQSPWLHRKGNPDTMVLMDVMGNSMEPEIHEGDTVLIDQSQRDIIAGGIYAVGVEDTVMVKRLEKRPGGLALMSDNHDYSPIVLRGEELETVRVIGKVIWLSREYR